MEVIAMVGQKSLIKKDIEPDEFIIMKELDSPELKVNHLSLYLKTAICEVYPDGEIDLINFAIDQINLFIFVNGVCEGNNSVRTLLAKNIVYQLTRQCIEIPFSTIYGFLNISKTIDKSTV